MNEVDEDKDFAMKLGQWLMTNYWAPLHHYVKENPDVIKDFPGILLKPEKIIYHIGRTHIGLEYIGPERIEELPVEITVETQVFDYSLNDSNLLDEIIGFNYDGRLRLPLQPFNEYLVLPTNAGADELDRLKWNYSAENMLLGFNSAGIFAPEGQFTRLINSKFFDASGKGGLKTRHIKLLDLIPCKYDDSGTEFDSFKIWLEPYHKLAEYDKKLTYPIPSDFRLKRLQKMNRFVEFVGSTEHSEPEITRLLSSSDLEFALKMRFSAKELYSECICEWQSEDKDAIKPDFFVVGSDGYADIVEFKLPTIKGSVVVGKNNRETFSSIINSYISQTRVYREYFDDPRNREYIKSKFGFDVYKPKRHLVIGRRWEFSTQEWRSIASDYQDLIIHSYDDIIDGVVTQFYD